MARSRVAPLLVTLVACALLGAACGSSGTAGTSSTTSTPVTSAPVTSPPASVLPSTTSTTGGKPFAATCSTLASALKVEELQPKNTGNWTAERQRILTDATSNASLYDAARSTAPAELVAPLGTLATYARFIGTSVSSSASFDAAVTAIAAYPDKVGASLATSTVDNWTRTNCR